jgi:hypothetical protein
MVRVNCLKERSMTVQFAAFYIAQSVLLLLLPALSLDGSCERPPPSQTPADAILCEVSDDLTPGILCEQTESVDWFVDVSDFSVQHLWNGALSQAPCCCLFGDTRRPSHLTRGPPAV